MKTAPNKDERLEIRLTSEELRYLKVAAIAIGQTPSSMLRMFIDSTITALKIKVNKGELKLEDYESILDDKL